MLQVASIAFLNPAPLLYDFEHAPRAAELRTRYEVHYTTPAQCAAELDLGIADLGLVPIAELASDLAIVPGCAIASLSEVRSILLLVKNPHFLSKTDALKQVRTLAADAASRSSQAYAQVLFRHFLGNHPRFHQAAADPVAMLADADAALLIGDPALLARERREEIEAAVGTPLLWLDVAALWRRYTTLPWVAAVWAVRPEALTDITPQQLTADLNASRESGLAHIDEIVAEWTPVIAVPPETIRAYLTENIHYSLDPACIESIKLFRSLAARINLLPPLPALLML
ncbi:MAG: menaquinone biosynthesis protein [Acidobacteriota bacterium]|nr:menaquinone biosynthesis protein [Acidobacteriota bacterium]